MYIPAWVLIIVAVALVGNRLYHWFYWNRLYPHQPISFRRYTPTELTQFLTDKFTIGKTSPFQVQKFLYERHIQFMYTTEPELTKDLKNADSYLYCALPAVPPTRQIRHRIFTWQHVLLFEFLEYKLVSIRVERHSDGYDLFGW